MIIPNYLKKFSNEKVDNLIKVGSLNPTFDDFGNILLSTKFEEPSASLITVNVENIEYEQSKIQELFDLEFTEFNSVSNQSSNDVITNVEDLRKDLKTKEQEIEDLNLRLNDTIQQINSVSNNEVLLNIAKSVIIELRIQLGQGETIEDFEDEIPFLPK